VVRKLLAKRSEDRFQTPGELATALADFASRRERSRVARRAVKPPSKPPASVPTPPQASSSHAPATVRIRAPRPRKARSTERMPRPLPERRRWLGPRTRGSLVVCGGFLVFVLSLGLLLRLAP
jgi:hypothetical protein